MAGSSSNIGQIYLFNKSIFFMSLTNSDLPPTLNEYYKNKLQKARSKEECVKIMKEAMSE